MEIVERLRRVLDGRRGVRLAALFGSTATKRHHARSDVDVGVLLDPDVDLPALGVELERATGDRVDLIPLDDAPPLLRFEIARDGVLLVARDAHEWPEFRARAMIDWWDWAPTARMMHRVMAERLREGSATWSGLTSWPPRPGVQGAEARASAESVTFRQSSLSRRDGPTASPGDPKIRRSEGILGIMGAAHSVAERAAGLPAAIVWNGPSSASLARTCCPMGSRSFRSMRLRLA